MQNDPKTPLIALLRALTDEQKDEFARLARTDRTYLYALGCCSRKSCRVDKAVLIETASRKLNGKYGTPIITAQELATMCQIA